jgi:hypothetical protein
MCEHNLAVPFKSYHCGTGILGKYDWRRPVNVWMHNKILISSAVCYVYKACNPTIQNLSIVKKDKFRIVGLQTLYT